MQEALQGAPPAAATSPIFVWNMWNISEVYLCGVTLCAYQMGLDLGVWLLGNICKSSFPDVFIILIDGSNRFREV